MKPRIEATREERLADKLDRLREPLVPTRVVKKREMRTPDDLARWDYEHDADRAVSDGAS